MNKREEDYLKIIYSLTVEKEQDLANTQEIAKALNITIQTANEMFKKLVKQNLVIYLPYKGVSLTKKGTKEAIRVIRAHRVLELFLTKTLKINWSEVHEDAEKLEHAASEKVIDSLYEFLGKPEKDPHGHLIPTLGKEYKLSTLNLFDLKEKETFIIIRVNEKEELFQYLNTNKIKIDDKFKVVKKDLIEKTITFQNKKIYQMNENIANNVFVEIIKEKEQKDEQKI